MTAEAMRPVKRVRGSGREIIEFMGDSVDEFSKKGIDYLRIYIIHIIYIISNLCINVMNLVHLCMHLILLYLTINN